MPKLKPHKKYHFRFKLLSYGVFGTSIMHLFYTNRINSITTLAFWCRLNILKQFMVLKSNLLKWSIWINSIKFPKHKWELLYFQFSYLYTFRSLETDGSQKNVVLQDHFEINSHLNSNSDVNKNTKWCVVRLLYFLPFFSF